MMKILVAILSMFLFFGLEAAADIAPECVSPTPITEPLDATQQVKFCAPVADINGINIPNGGLTRCIVDFVNEQVEIPSPVPGSLVVVPVPSSVRWVGSVSAWCETTAGKGEVDGPYAARFPSELPGKVRLVP